MAVLGFRLTGGVYMWVVPQGARGGGGAAPRGGAPGGGAASVHGGFTSAANGQRGAGEPAGGTSHVRGERTYPQGGPITRGEREYTCHLSLVQHMQAAVQQVERELRREVGTDWSAVRPSVLVRPASDWSAQAQARGREYPHDVVH
eukprot:1183136-Prorocentrum_minimum.AAC.4